MQRRVHAHAGIAQVPVDHGVHRLADLGDEAIGRRRQMRDLGLGGVGEARILDPDDVAGRECEPATVGRLATRGGVEDGAIEHDAARLGEACDGGVTGGEIGIVPEQTIGRHSGLEFAGLD